MTNDQIYYTYPLFQYFLSMFYFHFSIIVLFLTLLAVEPPAVSLLISPNNFFVFRYVLLKQ